MDLGNTIYRLRTEKNMSQGDLADALNVSRQSVSKWENNSAIPELDKLIKLSVLFGVSLDTLVGRSTSEYHEDADKVVLSQPPSQIVIRHQIHPSSIRHITGIVLIFVGLLFIPFALSASRYTPTITCLIVFGVSTLCGISILFSQYPYILCGWVLLSGFTAYVFLLLHWETEYLFLSVIGCTLAGMIWWTVHSHQTRRIHIPQWLWWIAGFILGLLLLLFFINFVPPFWISESHHAVAHG